LRKFCGLESVAWIEDTVEAYYVGQLVLLGWQGYSTSGFNLQDKVSN